MTKQHFEAFAEHIRVYYSELDGHTETDKRKVAKLVADVAQTFNPRFDRARFLKACGLGD
jgi:hypothetical protein